MTKMKQNPTFTPGELAVLTRVLKIVTERLTPDDDGFWEGPQEEGKRIYLYREEKESFDSAVKKILNPA